MASALARTSQALSGRVTARHSTAIHPLAGRLSCWTDTAAHVHLARWTTRRSTAKTRDGAAGAMK